MNQPPQEVLYRRINLVQSLMVAGWLLLLLVFVMISILLYGRLDQLNDRVRRVAAQAEELAERMDALAHAPPAPPRPAVEPVAAATAPQGPTVAVAPAGPPATRPDDGASAVATAPQGPTVAVAPADPPTTRPDDGPAYNVSPTEGLPKVDPDRPAGLPGWFHDLKTGAADDPDNPMLLLITGPQTVRDALEQLAKLDPAGPAARAIPADDRLRAAQLFLQTGDSRQAHRWALAVTRDAADQGRSWLLAGVASLRQKQYAAAIDELGPAVEKLPGRPEPLKALGEAYFGADRLDKAIDAYSRAVATVPADVGVASRLVDLLILARQIAPAIARLEAILKENPKLSSERARLAQLLIADSRPKEALEVIEAAPAAAPPDVRLHLARGQALMDVGDLPAAEAVLNKAVQETALSAEGWHLLGLARLKQRKNASAIVAFEQAIAVDSTRGGSWEYLGVALANEGKLDAAVARLQEAIRLNVGSAQTHYILALLHLWRRQFDAALPPLKEAVRLDPTYLDKARKEPAFNAAGPDSAVARFLKEGPPPATRPND